VVLATDLARPAETLEQLRDLDIPVVVIDRDPTIDGPAAKVRAVARALGVPERGEALARAMTAEIDATVQRARSTDAHPRIVVLYLRGSGVQLMFGRGTGVDTTIAAVGGVDVAAELGVDDTQQLTAESMLVAAPDVIIVTTSGLESVGGIDGLLAINGIGRTPAGRSRKILAYEDQFMLGMGPRYGQFIAQLADDLAALPSAG
jgi:iron complex transport system substrate-binding protein